jgi:ComF family protein
MRAFAFLAAEFLAATLAPPRCAACDRRVPLLTALCRACAVTVERVRHGDPRTVAAYAYGGAIGRAVARLKYERRPDLARPLGDLLWRAIEPHATELKGVVVVPVPLHPMRLAERGYNQSALLARRISPRLDDAQLWPRALLRTRDTVQQATLDREARMVNVANAFAVRGSARLHGRTMLLVDDVRTTGATLEACSQALRDAGAERVWWAVLACAG